MLNEYIAKMSIYDILLQISQIDFFYLERIMYRVKVKRRMSRKRLLKLLMALGLSKREAVRLRAEFPWKENMELFENFVYYWYHVKNIEHPVYREKFDMAYDAWTRFQLTDGKYVQMASRYWNATKNMMVIDSRKKVRNE